MECAACTKAGATAMMTALFEPGRGRAVSLGMPAVHLPARPCDSSPLAVVP